MSINNLALLLAVLSFSAAIAHTIAKVYTQAMSHQIQQGLTK
jgi:hypothetical protein